MNMRRRTSFLTAWCGCLVLGSLWITVSSAQDYRAKVQGVVTDSSQAVVPGATITLGNDNTGVENVKTSNENGHYVFDFVDPGTYTVTVDVPGFTKFVQKNMHGQVRGDVTVNAVLIIAELLFVLVLSGPEVDQLDTFRRSRVDDRLHENSSG